MASLDTLRPFIRLSVTNPGSDSSSAFGRGVANLCLGVREGNLILDTYIEIEKILQEQAEKLLAKSLA